MAMKDYVDAFTHRKPKWPLAGYAPGGYLGKCYACQVLMADVDKRAVHCFPCAVEQAQSVMEKQRAMVRELQEQIDKLKAVIQIVTPSCG
ncbi:hypothetical protein NKI13_24565 [Mesorhizobium australicum]|uniref:hypothetical protein n=1 Tax=Mesorhizobium australicum TaxID=536018 RepID=UPI00333AF69F